MGRVMPAYSREAYSYRFNFDGFVIYHSVSQEVGVASYLQMFRSGAIESVSTEPMWNNNGVLASTFFEGSLIRSALPSYLTTLQALGDAEPVSRRWSDWG